MPAENILLSVVEPADERSEEHAKNHRLDHGARVYTTDPTSRPRRPSAEQ
jgi:hypothetical protein